MVKNFRGGNKAKKRKNSSGDNSHRALKIRNKNSSSTDGQLYGKSLKRLGGDPAYVLVMCEDGVERICVIRGKFNKRIWINDNDYLIINYNKASSEKVGEVDYKYFPHEVSQLISRGEIDENKFKAKEAIEKLQDEGIIFADDKKEEKISENWNSNKNNLTFIADLDEDLEEEEWDI
tara:strand:- start:1182 stop:1712 length:531 start_codon:yes stop_codon:yes gene_type:complete